jgi:hypothetical protein
MPTLLCVVFVWRCALCLVQYCLSTVSLVGQSTKMTWIYLISKHVTWVIHNCSTQM